jgi:hypothetical protein
MTNIPTNSKRHSTDFTLDLHNKYMQQNNIIIISNKTDLDNNVNEYYVNNLLFRDKKDWVDGTPADIVALGCSHTYGIGVPQEYTWPSIIESKTQKVVANLGMCGASAEKMLESFFLYLDTVGIPKYLFACFPDHLRYSHVVEGNFFILNDNQLGNNLSSRKVVTHTRTSDYISGDVDVKNKIIKLPSDPRYLIPKEESLSQYISSIYIIEKLCKFLNIKFYWSTWHDSTRGIFLEKLFSQEGFCLNKDNFIETITSGLLANPFLNPVEYLDEQECNSTHEMNVEDYKKYQEMWKVASDKSHLGIHWQHHAAESFIKWIH